MSYDNTNRGSIWKNDRKETENHPDFTGTYVDEHGKEFWVSAWKRKPGAKENAPALSFTLREKEGKTKPAPKPAQSTDDFADDIPF